MFFTKRFKDLTGQKFGMWTVESLADVPGDIGWNCVCECGTRRKVNSDSLRKGTSTSCGCRRIEVSKTINLQHGESSGGKLTPEFSVYRGMLNRCNNPSDQNYFRYGGRGIKVCARWLESVANFVADVGRKPSPKHTIERIDNDKSYSPDNCKWATAKEQANNRRSSRVLDYNGKSHTLAQWGEITGIDADLLSSRFCKGWTVDQIFQTPVRNAAKWVTLNGERCKLSDLCRLYSIKISVVNSRLRIGWELELALTKPVHRKPKHE